MKSALDLENVLVVKLVSAVTITMETTVWSHVLMV